MRMQKRKMAKSSNSKGRHRFWIEFLLSISIALLFVNIVFQIRLIEAEAKIINGLDVTIEKFDAAYGQAATEFVKANKYIEGLEDRFNFQGIDCVEILKREKRGRKRKAKKRAKRKKKRKRK